MNASPAIRVTGLTKRFGKRTAFEDLDFEVAAGEVFGFLGPNGAGKTTTVRVLATLLEATSGAAEVAGLQVTAANGPELRRRISVMPENPGLYLKLSVRENLRFFAKLYGISRGDVDRRIDAVLAAVDLDARADALTGTLSKGLRQRVALARALLNEPRVLFLDEPTSGLDPEATREVRELLAGLRERGATVFLTTHRLEEAERLCDRVAILNTRLKSVGTPNDLRARTFGAALEVRLTRPLDDAARVYGAVHGVRSWALHGDTYVLEVTRAEEAAPEVARALVAADADVLRLAEVERSLEDVYLQLVSEGQR